ncbi:unnamed protein product, partial [marine sediment metagenome]
VLDNNNITTIKGLELLQDLQEISIKNNKIEEIEGFERFPHLVKISLDNNLIKTLKGLKDLKNLKTVDLSQNKIVEIDYRELPSIESINLKGNLIMRIKYPNLSSKFVLFCKINDRITVTMEDKEIKINIDNNASILFKENTIFIEKHGLRRQYTELDSRYSGFTEFTPVAKKPKARKKTKVHISEVYPLGIDTTNHALDGLFREICSNLQIWTEHEYDLRLLRKDLVFPLVEELEGIKDSMTEKILTEFENFAPEESEQEYTEALPEPSLIDALELYSEINPQESH